MPAGRREQLHGIRLGAFEHSREIADHAARPVGQRQLDRLVQVLDHTTEPAGELKDHDLA
jgi:hypothetical protein